MKKRMLSLLLALVMALGLSVPAFAAAVQQPSADIVYKGKDKLYIYPKTTEFTTSDLFGAFKGVMPGDTLTETVTFKNETTTTRSSYVKLYMRAELHSDSNVPEDEYIRDLEAMNAFLSQLTMTVTTPDGTEIYNDSPDKTGGLTENVLLGKFRKGEGTTLTVKLTVPKELDNNYVLQHGEVDWLFTAEEYRSSTPPDEPPETTPGTLIQTGQLNWPIWVMGGLGIALVALGATAIFRRRKDENA